MKFLCVPLMWVLAAMQSNGDSYRAYPDERRASEEVVLSLPSDIAILKIDGAPTRKRGHLLGAKYDRLILRRGTHQLTLRYEDLWDHEQGDDFEKVVSVPVTVTFTAQTPGAYRLVHPRPESLRAAQALKKSFSAADVSFQMIGETELIPATPAEEPATVPQSTVDVLKYWWNKTSEEERAVFLKWIDTAR